MPVSDEEWLVRRAKGCLKYDIYASKSWLITARTLFPRNFGIQYEAYNIEKSSKKTKEAAKLLEEMFVNFPQEPQLRSEVQSLSEALQSENTDEKTTFLRELFASIPSTLQCHMLLCISEITSDPVEQCRLLLVVLKRYPDRVPDQGVKLVDTLLSHEKHAHLQTPVNCYRKYLVCDVLPLVLKSALPDVTVKQLLRWLQKSIEFYVCYITQMPALEPLLSPTADLMSPTKKASVSYPGQGLRKIPIPGVSEKDCYIPQPWERLFEQIELLANQLKWKACSFFSNTSRDYQWHQVMTIYQQLEQGQDPTITHKQVFYSTLLLYLHCLYTYCSKVDSEQFAGSASGSCLQRPLVMIEGFKGADSSLSEYRHKKMKTDALPQISASKTITSANEIVQNFLTALKCWELLHTELLEKDFAKLLQHWKADTWVWMKAFEIDVLIYQGLFREAINRLQSAAPSIKEPSAQVRSDLQVACCYYSLGNFSKACDLILKVVSALPAGAEPATAPVTNGCLGRQILLLTCCESEVLPYCIQLMITCFRDKAFKTYAPDDMSLGHMIVLLQYDWPRHERLFAEVLTKIQKMGSFSYSLFFNYVVNIDILEEFAYLKTQEGGKVNLDILPTSTKVSGQQRTVTRGVNKGVKEDFKFAMEKQVARSNENIETIIRQFLTEEKDILQQNLL